MPRSAASSGSLCYFTVSKSSVTVECVCLLLLIYSVV